MKNFIKIISVLFIILLSTNAFAEEAVSEDEGYPITGWGRLDHDFLGFGVTIGAVHQFNDSIGLVSDIYVFQADTSCSEDSCTSTVIGELDVGVAIFTENLSIFPMMGIAFDWKTPEAQLIVPPALYLGLF